MGARVAAIVAATSIALVAKVAAAQPAQPAPPAPAPPPGMVPMYPPGATPGGAPAPGATPAAPAPAPGYAPPGYAPPGYGYGYGYPPPGYGAPGGYYPPPYSYYPPGANLVPPTTLPYEEGQSVPHGYQLKGRPVRSLVIAGSVTFGTTYLVSILTTSTVLADSPSDGKKLAPLFAPVVGPFIAIGTARSSGAGTLMLVLDGLAQTGGAAMLIVGLAAEEKYLQRAVTARPDVLIGPGSASLRWSF